MKQLTPCEAMRLRVATINDQWLVMLDLADLFEFRNDTGMATMLMHLANTIKAELDLLEKSISELEVQS